MFAVEVIAGLAAGSAALQADALDFLGDAANYGISLFVVGMALRYRASAALAKSATMGAFLACGLSVPLFGTPCTARCRAPSRWVSSDLRLWRPMRRRLSCYGPTATAIPICGLPGFVRAMTCSAIWPCFWPLSAS